MAQSNLLSAERLRQILDYSADTGVFAWKIRKGGTANVGAPAGWLTHGYRKITVDGRIYYAHRLAWLYVHGEWPVAEVDHIDGVPDNNAIRNLRLADHFENMQNARRARDNISGHKGVSYSKQRNHWRAEIRAYGKRYYLGCFATAQEAAEARADAARVFHGKFARPG